MSARPKSGRYVQIQRNGKRRLVSEQTQRDSIRLSERIRRNAGRIRVVESCLEQAYGRMSMSNLASLADRCVNACQNSIALDRLAKRSRPALFCWFCENWSVIWPVLLQQQTGPPQSYAPVQHLEQVPQVDDIHPLSIVALLNH
jgi:hypothetical protein